VAALASGLRNRGRAYYVWVIYGGFAVLAFWISLGPRAGLYRVLYAIFPVFGLTRAPSRFGLIVTFALAVAGAGLISATLRRFSRPVLAAGILITVGVVEALAPLSFTKVPPVEPAYHMLATLPPGPVLEIPVYSPKFAFARTQYMLSSTVHWMPLVDAYSDVIPEDFLDASAVLANFPTREAFKVMERDRVRYVIFHTDMLDTAVEDDIRRRLREFDGFLARRYADDRIWLFEIVGFPP
jgi:hypothetical protein